MRKFLKGLGVSLAVLIGLVVVALLALNGMASARLNKVYPIPEQKVVFSSDAAAIERGKHLVAYRCVECHGTDFGGSVMLDDPMLGTIIATNIASGIGKDGKPLSDDAFARVLRHGVDTDGKALVIMPAQFYRHLNNQDLNDIVAYVRSLPAVDDSLPTARVSIIGRALMAAGVLGKIIPAESIDHMTSQLIAFEPGTSATYGEYLVKTIGCQDCHGENLTGGKLPGPGNTMAPDLTPNGNLNSWTAKDFLKAIRTGTTPDGRHLSPAMPWIFQSQMTDDELIAVFLYLQSLPAETVVK